MDDVSKMVRVGDGWILLVHDLYQKDNGDVYWSYSTKGYWEQSSINS